MLLAGSRPTAAQGPLPIMESRVSPLLRKCTHIQGDLLRRVDPPLHRRLDELGVQPQLYLLRWLSERASFAPSLIRPQPHSRPKPHSRPSQ